MTDTKTFGQIAHDASAHAGRRIAPPYNLIDRFEREMWERTAAAVALECSRICIELSRGHLLKAQDQVGEESIGSYYRQLSAIECAEAIREAISFSTKDTP